MDSQSNSVSCWGCIVWLAVALGFGKVIGNILETVSVGGGGGVTGSRIMRGLWI
jgi:hypothetical protein